MARSNKKDFDYFPLNVDTHNDFRIKYLNSQYGEFIGEIYFIKFLQFLCRNAWGIYDTRDSFKEMELCTVMDMMEDEIIELLQTFEKTHLIVIDEPFIYCEKLLHNLKDAITKRKEYKEFKQNYEFEEREKEKLTIVEQVIETKPGSLFSETEIKKTFKQQVAEIDVNELLKNPEVQEAYKGYREMRRKKKAVFTERAQKMFVKKLNELAGDDVEKAVKIINRSEFKSWTDIYQLDEKPQTNIKRPEKSASRKTFGKN